MNLKFSQSWSIFAFFLLCSSLHAADCKVLVDGAGCRTRQLAMQRIWEKLPNVESVEILPRDEAPELNQRIFIIRSEGEHPTKDALIEALGRRAKHYHVLEVASLTPASENLLE